MSTRDVIIQVADNLIREKGYNAFSFKDISNSIGIKTASIHYHFPTKTDLAQSIIADNKERLIALKESVVTKTPLEKLEGFFSIYSRLKTENQICLVGSLATDLNTVDEAVQEDLRAFAQLVIEWVTDILEEGKEKGDFDFIGSPRTKALMIITNVVAILQLSRLTSESDFELVKQSILKELTVEK